MNSRSVTMMSAVLLLVGGGVYYALQLPPQKIPTKALTPISIKLEIVIDGGFAYIPENPNTLNIAYLNSWKYANPLSRDGRRPAVAAYSCNVQQMGTDLSVLEGEIIEPSSGQLSYDLDGTVVTFPALQTSTAALSATRGPRPGSPFKPADVDDPIAWEDLRFVPSLLAEHGAKLNPKWREKVNGFMVLKGGTLKGARPGYNAGYAFDFRNGVTSKFIQSITDRTLYTVDIPGNQVVIDLDADAGPDRIVVKPSGSSRIVRLSLIGRHNTNVATGHRNDDPLKEHCTFYQLFDPVPLPMFWLTPHWVDSGSGTDATAHPSTPGFFCPGDWF